MYMYLIDTMVWQRHAVLSGMVGFTPHAEDTSSSPYTYIMPPFIEIQYPLQLEVVLKLRQKGGKNGCAVHISICRACN